MGGQRSVFSLQPSLTSSQSGLDHYALTPYFRRVVSHPPTADFLDLQSALAGRYSLERELGRGGMGIVFLARDVALDRPVAIKLLPPALATTPDHRARFLREARTAAALSHPNIVPIHLVEERDGLVYFVMAFVDGESLGDRVRRAGPIKPAEVARIVQEVGWALGYAHARGVIHRDVKPDNILLDRGSGRAMVTDFGIARVVTTQTSSSAQGEVLGTLQYMSPEQASADAIIDGRADLYSLGVTAFFALTGRLPFEAPNPAALLAMHVTAPAPPVRSVAAYVPAKLAEAVDRCLAKDPDARFENGEALAAAIADAQVTRKEVAPSVREFLSVAKSTAVQTVVLAVFWYALSEEATAVRGNLGPLYLMLFALTIAFFARPLHAARAVVRAGMNELDVAAAAALGATVRDANVDFEADRARKVGERMSRWPVRVAIFAVAALTPVYAFPSMLRQLLMAGSSAVHRLATGSVMLVAFAELALLVALAVAPRWVTSVFTRGTPENAGFLRQLWSGRVARWFFRIAGIGLAPRAAAPPVETAHTELLLGRAAESLFGQLPAASRSRLGDVVDVVRGLERAASALRDRRDALDASLADLGPASGSDRQRQLAADLQSARMAAEERLGTAVTALENLRLDLLRARSGLAAPDELTAALDEARALGVAVDAELQGRREVEKIVGPRRE